MEQSALFANLAATLFMTGVIWFVQLVHYPLFAYYRDDAFAVHAQRTAYVVAVPMLVEAFTALLLLVERPTNSALWVGLLLVGAIWLSTNFLQIPMHAKLESGFDLMAQQRLVQTNWIRTVAWSARSALMLWAVATNDLHRSQ